MLSRLIPRLLFSAMAVAAQTAAMPMPSPTAPAAERLGTVDFPVSCKDGAAFDRGVALLHDFWYEEAEAQFTRIATADPGCAMAHWGLAMSRFHQIWDRPDPATLQYGWAELEAARKDEARKPVTPREAAYIAALADFFRPGPAGYPARIAAYSAAMGRLYAAYPADVNAGAFYALSLLADTQPGDTTLAQNRKAMEVLRPLFAKDPDNPGVDHYIVHACDNPAMAAEGLAAADHYGEIAASGPHAFHMPGHIYARLGMWPQDIASQRGSIAASERAETHGMPGMSDEPHSYDFLLYALLQSGQDAEARALLGKMPAMLARSTNMAYMRGMDSYYTAKYAVFYDLETRDWKAAAAYQPPRGSSPEDELLIDWAHAIADGHLHRAAEARANLAHYDGLVAEIRKGSHPYVVEGTGTRIATGEIEGWTAFAEGHEAEALTNLRAAADLQDKVGQGEVDIPAREMLADMLLSFGHPREALASYQLALKESPNRLNGLYGAARAAEGAGDPALARQYYADMLKQTDGGAGSQRPELAEAKKYLASRETASR